MQMDPASLQALGKEPGEPGPAGRRNPDVGACFQLALLAADKGDDQEAGGYLRQIIAGMKVMVQTGGTGAGAG